MILVSVSFRGTIDKGAMLETEPWDATKLVVNDLDVGLD